MSINIKKYTKEQMAKMVEEAQRAWKEEKDAAATYFEEGAKLAEENEKLRGQIAAHIDTISQMNGEAINKANEIANLKADADALRTKLADTEAALGRANADVAHWKSELSIARKEATDAQWAQVEEYKRANCAENHPWRNLWAWVKRKLGRKAGEE